MQPLFYVGRRGLTTPVILVTDRTSYIVLALIDGSIEASMEVFTHQDALRIATAEYKRAYRENFDSDPGEIPSFNFIKI